MILFRNRKKSKLVSEPRVSTFPVSDIRVRQHASESPTLIHSSKLSSADGSSKVLLSWLEDLPTHDQVQAGYSPAGVQPAPAVTRSPQRQRMLTNGSFVKVKITSFWQLNISKTIASIPHTRFLGRP